MSLKSLLRFCVLFLRAFLLECQHFSRLADPLAFPSADEVVRPSAGGARRCRRCGLARFVCACGRARAQAITRISAAGTQERHRATGTAGSTATARDTAA